MPTKVVPSYGLSQHLVAQGFELPKECIDVQMEMPSGGVFVLHYRCYVTPEDMVKLGQALVEMGKAQL